MRALLLVVAAVLIAVSFRILTTSPRPEVEFGGGSCEVTAYQAFYDRTPYDPNFAYVPVSNEVCIDPARRAFGLATLAAIGAVAAMAMGIAAGSVDGG